MELYWYFHKGRLLLVIGTIEIFFTTEKISHYILDCTCIFEWGKPLKLPQVSDSKLELPACLTCCVHDLLAAAFSSVNHIDCYYYHQDQEEQAHDKKCDGTVQKDTCETQQKEIQEQS